MFGGFTNEEALYKDFRTKFAPEERALKILIVGELAYNPERIHLFEKLGHKLFGLWIKKPNFYNTVGPLPFGHIPSLDSDNWQLEIDKIRPDIIYALLNHQAIHLAHQVMTKNPTVSFVWHFKEGPFFSRQSGTWSLLVDLYNKSGGQIYINESVKDWFGQSLMTSVLDSCWTRSTSPPEP